MSTWSKSSLKLPSVVVTDKSFPALGGGTPSGPPSKKPVLSFAQKVKEMAEAEAAAKAEQQTEAQRLAAAKLLESAERRQTLIVSQFYKPRTNDEDYVHEDSSPDEMDYETAHEYEMHLRYNRRQRERVVDYSKDLSSEEDTYEDTHDDRAI
jgi:hypothetical protein